MDNNDVVIKRPLNRILFALLGDETLVEKWWNSPNLAFDNQTPENIYQSDPEGRIKVKKYLMDQVAR